MWLKQMGYFKRVRVIFLIVGHTKNACDRLFNSLKKKYRLTNIFTVTQLIQVLSESKKITINQTAASDFLDYDGLMKHLYKDLKLLVKKNHIFDCTEDGKMIIKESNLDEHGTAFNGLKKSTPTDLVSLKVVTKDLLKEVTTPGINPYKQIELFHKYKPVVPTEYHNDELYTKPSEEVIKKVMAEKAMRKENKSKIKMLKAGGGGNEVKLTEGVQFDEDVKKMKVDDLKKTLTIHGLATKGLKLELQTRLQNFRDNCKTTTTTSGSGSQVDRDVDQDNN